jgi:microcystin-dependent protein
MSTPTSNYAFQKIGYNEDSDTWGTDEGQFKDKLDLALSGVLAININGLTSYSVTWTNYAVDQYCNRTIVFTGTLGSACTVTIPPVMAKRTFYNNTSGAQNVVLQVQGTGNTYTITPGCRVDVTCDGTTIYDSINTIGGSLIVQGTLSANSIVAGGGVLPISVGGTGATSAAAAFANLVPTGTVLMWCGTAPATGFVFLQGQELSRTGNAALFSVIGTTYGAGDGVTTFNVPNAMGRFPLGAGSGTGLTTRRLGDIGGEENHTLTTNELPTFSLSGTTATASNDHTHSGTTGTENQTHTHNITGTLNGGQGGSGGSNTFSSGVFTSGTENQSHNHSFTTGGMSANHTHTFTTNSIGGSQGHNTMPPFFVVGYIIKT